MHIFIGADHGGFELKNILIEFLQEKNIRVEDMGAYQDDPLDDFPDFAHKVAQAVLQNPAHSMGIVICRSGVGVCITANRYKGIYCAHGFNDEEVRKAREHDFANVLAIGADYVTEEEAKKFVEIFLSTSANSGEKYARRMKKIDQSF